MSHVSEPDLMQKAVTQRTWVEEGSQPLATLGAEVKKEFKMIEGREIPQWTTK